MAKEAESLSKFDDTNVNKIGEALYAAVFLGECDFSLERHEHPDYDPYGEDTLIPEYFWTLTAKPKESNLEVTMIVHGMSWTQIEELWFSKESVDYTCRSEVINRSPSLKKFKIDFLEKAEEIHNAQLAKEEEIERKQKERDKIEEDKEVNQIISSPKSVQH